MAYELGKSFSASIEQRVELPPFDYRIPNEEQNAFMLDTLPRSLFRNSEKTYDTDQK